MLGEQNLQINKHVQMFELLSMIIVLWLYFIIIPWLNILIFVDIFLISNQQQQQQKYPKVNNFIRIERKLSNYIAF